MVLLFQKHSISILSIRKKKHQNILLRSNIITTIFHFKGLLRCFTINTETDVFFTNR